MFITVSAIFFIVKHYAVPCKIYYLHATAIDYLFFYVFSTIITERTASKYFKTSRTIIYFKSEKRFNGI